MWLQQMNWHCANWHSVSEYGMHCTLHAAHRINVTEILGHHFSMSVHCYCTIRFVRWDLSFSFCSLVSITNAVLACLLSTFYLLYLDNRGLNHWKQCWTNTIHVICTYIYIQTIFCVIQWCKSIEVRFASFLFVAFCIIIIIYVGQSTEFIDSKNNSTKRRKAKLNVTKRTHKMFIILITNVFFFFWKKEIFSDICTLESEGFSLFAEIVDDSLESKNFCL